MSAEEKQRHIEDLQDSQKHLADVYVSTVKSLALAIDARYHGARVPGGSI